ncbi:hypothetical protein QP38_0003 [Levilactobacillus brevis]|nr:hypothetical protein QP38_0003 [Levilactobacillus brevis]
MHLSQLYYTGRANIFFPAFNMKARERKRKTNHGILLHILLSTPLPGTCASCRIQKCGCPPQTCILVLLLRRQIHPAKPEAPLQNPAPVLHSMHCADPWLRADSPFRVPDLLQLPGELPLALDDDGDVVLAVDHLDAGARDLGLHRVAAAHGEELVVAAVVDGDPAGELVPDDLEPLVDLAGAAADDVVEGVPGGDVGVAEEAVHQVSPHPTAS